MSDWLIGPIVGVAALRAATLLGLVWKARDGRFRRQSPVRDEAAAPSVLASLGVRAGTPATLLQFSSAFCAPCRATRRVCAEVVGMLDGVRHIEVDAEQHLDAVRALDVRRTPTVLVIDREGRVVKRASGQPAKAHLIAALAPLLQASGVSARDGHAGDGDSDQAAPGDDRKAAE